MIMDPMMGKPPDGPYEWSNMHAYHSPPLQSPAHEYGGFGFAVSPHDMSPESPFGRHPSQMYAAPQHPQPVFQPQWPSMLTNASMRPQPPPQHQLQHQHPPPHPPPPQHQPQMPLQPPLAPLTTMSAPPQQLTPLTTQPQPQQQPPARRTLTDQDRRRMCQYHEDNPSVKQTEIGGETLPRDFFETMANPCP